MYAIHTGLIYYGEDRVVYAAQVVSCKWTNKARGKWCGRVIRDTGAKLEFRGDTKVHAPEHRAQCDDLSRREAKRLGMASGPDTFPFA